MEILPHSEQFSQYCHICGKQLKIYQQFSDLQSNEDKSESDIVKGIINESQNILNEQQMKVIQNLKQIHGF